MKTIFAFLIFSSCAFAQDGRYGTSTGTSGAITTVTAREKTGWTSNGTTAQDTLATVYRLDKANIRFIVTDADGDTLWFYPQNLHPLILKDGTLLLSGVDSTGRGYFGGNAATAGQTRRALLNVVGVGDTVAAFIGDGNRAPGDSSVLIHANADLQSASRAGFGVNTSGQGSRAILNAASRAGGDSLLVLTAESNYGVGDSSIIVHGDAVMQSGARAGFGATTKGQATRAFMNVLGRAANDTLAIWSNDGGGVVGDSAWIITGAGVLSSAKATASTNILIAGSSAIGNYSTGYARFMHASQSDNGAAIIQGSSGDTYVQSASGQGILFRVNAVRMAEVSSTGEFSTGGNFAQQAAMQVRKAATADTLFMARNDKNSTLDSTMMVFANGKIYYTADPVVAELYVTDNSGGTPETYGTSYIKCAQFTTVGDTARMTAAGDSLTCQVPGTYAISANISFSGTVSATFYVEIRKNSAAIAGARFVRKLGTGGDVGNASCQAVTTLVAGDDISIHVKADDAAKDFLIHEGNLRAMILR